MSWFQINEAVVDRMQSVKSIGDLPLKVDGHYFTKESDPEQLL